MGLKAFRKGGRSRELYAKGLLWNCPGGREGGEEEERRTAAQFKMFRRLPGATEGK